MYDSTSKDIREWAKFHRDNENVVASSDLECAAARVERLHNDIGLILREALEAIEAVVSPSIPSTLAEYADNQEQASERLRNVYDKYKHLLIPLRLPHPPEHD